MKKIVALLMALTMLLGLLSGCGSAASAETASGGTEVEASEAAAVDEEDNTAEDADVEDSAAEDVPEVTGMTIEENEAMFPLEENVTFTIYYPFAPPLIMMGYEDPAELNFFKTLAEMTNVTLEFTTVSVETLSEQFNLVVAGGDYPDIFSQCMDQYTGGAGAAIEDGVIIDLAPYVDEYAPHYKAMMEEDQEFRKYNYTDDGQMSQFMAYYQDVYVNQGYFINTDWLNEVGMDMPVTYDDWYDVLLAFDNKYDMEVPAKGVPTSGYHGVLKDNFMIRDGEAVFVPADETVQSAYLEQCDKWYSAGLYTAEVLIDGYYTDTDLRGMVTSGNLMLNTCDVDQYKVFQEELSLAPVALPVLKEGDTPYQVVNQARAGNGNTITTSCEDVDTLVAYMDYWYSDEVILLANWGTEGETYTVSEDGSYAYTDEVLNFSGGLNLATSVFCAGWEPTVLDWHRKDSAYTDDQLSAIETWNVFDASTNYPTYASFTQEETEIISTTLADINTFVDENYTQFETGEKHFDTDFDAYVDTLYSMGLQDVIDVYQNAYDRYMAR